MDISAVVARSKFKLMIWRSVSKDDGFFGVAGDGFGVLAGKVRVGTAVGTAQCIGCSDFVSPVSGYIARIVGFEDDIEPGGRR